MLTLVAPALRLARDGDCHLVVLAVVVPNCVLLVALAAPEVAAGDAHPQSGAAILIILFTIAGGGFGGACLSQGVEGG